MNWLAALAALLRRKPNPPRPVPVPTPPRPTPPLPIPVPASDPMLAALNVARAQHGKPELTIHPTLMAYAGSWADAMAGRSTLSHSDDPYAECVGEGYPDAAALVAGFMSEGDPPPGGYNHRSIALGDWKRCGWGMARDRAGIPYWCVIFTADR